MIVVTGATGKLGRAIVEQLVRRVGPAQIGASVRDPGKAQDLASEGVRVRAGDFADPESLRRSFEGAGQVLVVSSNAAQHGGDTLGQHRNAIEAARAVGARRIVYTSHMAVGPASAFPPMHSHMATEEMLADCGLAWTALRNGFYAESAIGFMGDAPKTGVVAAPEDGQVAWTAHADLAEGAAVILADEGRFDGPTPPLTGSAALDLAALAGIASNVLGRPVRHQVVTEDALRAKLTERGAPPQVADILVGFYRASRAGEFAAIDPALQRLLGREPTTMQEVLAASLR